MLMEHNKETYEQFKDMLLEHNECCLVAATGAGKTHITLQLIKDLKLKALIICHRIAIQDEWQKIINKYNITDNISFTTYQMFSKNYDIFDGYDVYIFDEAHHMGSKVWGRAIEEFRSHANNNPMIIGLTADPNRYEINIRRMINNVAHTIFNNHAVYGRNRSDAIEDGIFLPAQYVYAIFDIDDIRSRYSKIKVTDELTGRLNLSIDNCLKIDEILIKHTSTLSKIKGILFVEDIESITNGKKLIEKTFPDLPVYVIHSKLDRKENSETIKLFENSDSGFIISVEMINEGVHFSGINTIIMLRRTQSPSLYNQQIGRAFSSNAINNAIIFDLVGNLRSIKNTLNSFSMEPNHTIIKPSLEDADKVYERNISGQHIIYDYATDILNVLDEIDLFVQKNRPWTADEDAIVKEYYTSIGTKALSEMLINRTIESIRARAIHLNLTRSRDKWTPEEDEILRKYYPSIGIDGVREMLGNNRTDNAIYYRLSLINRSIRRWTPEEDEILRKYYPSIGLKGVSEMLKDRTKSSIKNRICHIHIPNPKNYWTPEEDEILHKYYPLIGTEGVRKMLKNRSKNSIRTRASRLGIDFGDKCHWTPEEDEILRKYYPSIGSKGVSEMLKSKSRDIIKYRAKSLGLTQKRSNWTSEEDEILRKYYPSIGLKGVSEILNCRSVSSIKGRVIFLKIASERYWTSEEDEILRKYYPSIGIDGIREMFKRKRTDAAIIDRVEALKLSSKK